MVKQMRISGYTRSKPGKSKAKSVKVKGHTKIIKVKKQTGRKQSPRGQQVDDMRKALKPGRRETSGGTTYTETRRNRSDTKGRR